MNYLAQQVEALAKQASVGLNRHPFAPVFSQLTSHVCVFPFHQEISMYDVKSAVNKAKAMVLNLSEIETQVREATNDDAWGASSTVMQEIAQATFNFQLFNEIMPTIYQRFTEKEARQWRQIYKSLVLLEYLVKNGSERVIDDARAHLSLIKVLRNFHYTDEAGKDQGINVRNRSRELAELLSDLDKVRQERRKAKANRSKYTGVGNDGSGGGGPSFTSASGSRYGGFGSDSLGSGSGGGSSGGGGGGRSSGFQDSSQQSAEYEEYDAGEWDDRGNSAGGRSSSGSQPSRSSRPSSRTTSSQKATPALPTPAPPKQEVNLFDFDDDEQQPVVPAKPPTVTSNLDDDFDDFQSASPAQSTVPAPTAYQNVFDLLKANKPTVAPSPISRPSYSQPTPPSYQQPLSSFSPLQASSRQQSAPASAAGSRPQSALAPPTAAKAPAPASDFSDLFSSFGSTPAVGSSTASTGPKLTLAQIAAQKRQEQLWSQGAAKPASNTQNGGSDWDSLI